jgi:hypothetical protein
MLKTTGSCLIASFVFFASAETINISGTVANKNGKPISDAIVTLPSQNLADTTNADGRYVVTNVPVPVNVTPLMHGAEAISIGRGRILLNLTVPSPVTIEVFDTKGQILERIFDRRVRAGDFGFELPIASFAPRILMIRVSIGQRTFVFRYIPLTTVSQSVISSGVVSYSSSSMTEAQGSAKTQAGADMLKIFAPWYVSKDTSIAFYQGTMNISLDTLSRFSFFATSLKAIQRFSKSQNGFGGDLRFGKTGQGAGLLGADSICQCIAESSMPGSKIKQWRAFFSVAKGPNDAPVNAIDRIGQGPWYDRLGRLLSNNIGDLLHTRPASADLAIRNDLPNEDGVPNHRPDPNWPEVDNHRFITGSDSLGKLKSTNATCEDWTSTTCRTNPEGGLAWPRTPGGNSKMDCWMANTTLSGCLDSVDLKGIAGAPTVPFIGFGGGYGGFYCFALKP